MPKKNERPATAKKRIIEQYIRKFSKTPNLTLARTIYNDMPEMFSNVEAVRTLIRSVKGTSDRKNATYPEFAENRDHLKNPFKLPESDVKEWLPYILPKNANNILVLSDIHLPYHDITAVTLALQYGKEKGINTILLNGDLLDFYALSRFDKDPRSRSFSGELEMARHFFLVLRSEFPDAHIYFKTGNHEERYEKYLLVKAPELLGIEEFKLVHLLKAAEYGVNVISDKRIIMAGKLPILHGHEFLGATSQAVNPARGLFMKTAESCVIGHLHKSSEHNEMTLTGELKTTWSSGCLCDLTPEYARINKWNHGFCHVTVQPNGHFSLKNLRIFDGAIL